VADRFGAAVTRHSALAAGRHRTLVIGTHGLALTVWLASLMRLDPDPAQFWERLRFPDVIEVDLVGRTASPQPGH
jgi:2,3-bisphosphoglycerate-dependent phosphoglycerate mutase